MLFALQSSMLPLTEIINLFLALMHDDLLHPYDSEDNGISHKMV